MWVGPVVPPPQSALPRLHWLGESRTLGRLIDHLLSEQVRFEELQPRMEAKHMVLNRSSSAPLGNGVKFSKVETMRGLDLH